MFKRFLSTALTIMLLLIAFNPGQSNADRGDIEVTLPSTPGAPGSNGSNGQQGSSCPKYQKSGIYTQIGGGSPTAPTYGYFEYTCDGVTWTQVWGCLSNCPIGVTQLVEPPTPAFIEAELVKSAPTPEGFFAPPVHRNGIAAITGLRLYVNITEETYRVVTADIVRTGQWYASGIATPGNITLDVDGVAATCKNNPPSPATENGRNQSTCFVPITTVPKGGKAHVTLTVQWRMLIDTNVGGVTKDFVVNKITELDIKVKELQAVGVR